MSKTSRAFHRAKPTPSALEKIQSYDGSGRPGAQPKHTDDQLRQLWRDAGGTFYGPNVEHGDMEEAKLLPFLRRLMDLLDRTTISEPTPPTATALERPLAAPVTNEEIDLACEAYIGPPAHADSIRAAVDAVLARRVAAAQTPPTAAELAKLHIRCEEGWATMRENDKSPPFMTYHARSAARCHRIGGERIVRVRRITIWSKA